MANANSQFGGFLTNVGVAKQTNANALQIPWKITRMQLGDGGGEPTQAPDPVPRPDQTGLIRVVHDAPLNALYPSPGDPGVLIAELVLPPNIGGFWIRETALRDEDGDLIAVAAPAPSYKPQLNQGSGRTQTIRMHVVFGNIANVQLKVDPSIVLATRQYVDAKDAEKLDRNEVTVSPTDTTPGRLLRTGDGGWMGDVPTYIADLDDRTIRGFGYVSHTHTANASPMPFAYAQVLTFGNTGDQIHQEAWEVAPPGEGEPTRTGRRAWRSTYGNKPWGAWDELISTKNIHQFAPSLAGYGATGTWGISVYGSAQWATEAGYTASAGHAQTAGSATSAGDAARANALALLGNMYCSFHWEAPGGQPSYLLGTTDGANGYLYNPADFNVKTAMRAGLLNWSAYSGHGIGDGLHLIFDASIGLAPNGTAIGNVDPAQGWSAGYPTLMGWNGQYTYGVRVDRARQAEQLAQNIILNGAALNAGSNVTLTAEQLGFLDSIVGESGWTRMPNGWILQTGIIVESAHATDYRNFPTEFPNAAFAVILQYDATGTDGFAANYGTAAQIVDRARFVLSAGGTFTGGGVCRFIAIGK